MRRVVFSRGSGLVRVAMALLLMAPLMAVSAHAAATIDSSAPQRLIETSSQALLADLDANRAAYRKDPAGLYRLVENVFLPHVDVEFAAQQVLGKYWREADAAQRKRFVTAFYQSLLRTYGDALVEFTSDRLKVLPYQGDPAADRGSVRTEIRRSNGSLIAVNYGVRKTASGEWKAWDVVIEGISYVKSFREDFGREIEQKGLEAVIQRLESGSAPAVSARGKG
jgi:phospholipid transport system substrate-binding protein